MALPPQLMLLLLPTMVPSTIRLMLLPKQQLPPLLQQKVLNYELTLSWLLSDKYERKDNTVALKISMIDSVNSVNDGSSKGNKQKEKDEILSY